MPDSPTVCSRLPRLCVNACQSLFKYFAILRVYQFGERSFQYIAATPARHAIGRRTAENDLQITIYKYDTPGTMFDKCTIENITAIVLSGL